jgi:hypothetical protein
MDAYTATGFVRVIKQDPETGLVLFDEWFKNQLTNFARQQSAALWVGTVVQTPTKIAMGTGSPPAGQTSTTPNDTALWNELAGTRQTVNSAVVFLSYYSQYTVTYSPNTQSTQITEAGLFDNSGNLWSHVKLTGVTWDTTASLSIIWQVLHQGN